jgi:hypothetical protein
MYGVSLEEMGVSWREHPFLNQGALERKISLTGLTFYDEVGTWECGEV